MGFACDGPHMRKRRPKELKGEIDRLRQERDEARACTAALQASLDQLTQMTARQGDQLEQIVSMLRRREDQLKKSAAEIRRLRKKLGLDDDDPEPSRAGAPDEGGDGGDGGEERASVDGAVVKDDSVPKAESSAQDPGIRAGGASAKGGSRPRSHGGRCPPPEHLGTDIERHDVCACGDCGGRVLKRDQLRTRIFTVVPSYVRCREVVRERVICTQCSQPTTAPMPALPVSRGLYDCSFIAWLVVVKFVLLVPLDRIRLLLVSQGVDLAMGTLVSLIERAAKLCDPVDGEVLKQLKGGRYMCFDGTGLKALVLHQTKAWDGYLEVYTRDELTVFQFDLTKYADGLRNRLADYEEMLVCDAESRNGAGAPNATLAYCNAHPLRAFRDAERVQPELAKHGKRFIQDYYDLEDVAKERGFKGDALVAFRQRRTRPVAHRFREWLQGVVEMDLPPSDPVGKIARYYLRHFDNLTRFIDHAELPPDNNGAEREFQRHAKLRQASLFAGSVEGAHRWATLLGVARTAQKCELDVQAYLTWLFERQGSHKKLFAMSAAELTPMAYRDMLQARRQAA